MAGVEDLSAVAAGVGAAETLISGGGKVTSPSRTMVMLRTTSSSKSMTRFPSLPGVMSLRALTRLVP